MSKSKSNKGKMNTNAEINNFEDLLREEVPTVDHIPIDWLPKKEPITETMSYENSGD
ncbi:hypothetical protein [Bacillus sp. EAC]|uniref:hypothetical protein n=1 Tax=Bacillus sp. EAC TaxID=1978338 RepID=UPI0015C51E5A|nr:hypothetical protein [Bacillus sp. EAC]